MPRNLSTWLLAIAVFTIVAIAGFAIASVTLDVESGSSEGTTAGEQRVLFSDLGMT